MKRRVHPRACGGNLRVAVARIEEKGASPRLRGKLGVREQAFGDAGCIPAPAGETTHETASSPLHSVHPRACGGNGYASKVVAGDIGASPRLRGKPRPAGGGFSTERCIPAPAGETA